jgi:heavy metal sensor kinase
MGLSRLRGTRIRLTLVYTAIFATVVAIAAAAFWIVLNQVEYGSIDASLASQTQVVLANLEIEHGRVTLSKGEALPGETSGGIAVTAVLFGPDGRIIDQSPKVPTPDAYRPVATSLSGPVATSTIAVAGRHERVRSQRLDLGNGTTGVLVIARPVDELEQTLFRVGILLGVVGLALVAGAAGLGYWLLGRALRPVRVMSATARDITEHDLKRRIALDLPEGDEIADLAATLNAMLDRLEKAFESLQQFTADAAHELRAPLALMRTQVDVILRRNRSPNEYRESHRTLLTEIERLSRLADQLLLLARADAGSLAPQNQTVHVSDLLEETIDRWRQRAVEGEVALRRVAGEEAVLEADPELLRRVLDNLLDNALRHTPPGGTVAVSTLTENGAARIVVEDSGPGVDPQLVDRIFDRFTRADSARGRDSGGSGLGLALSAAIVQAHGGSIELDNPSSPGAGARFIVVLPLTDNAPGDR